MVLRNLFRSPRHLLVLFLAVTLLPAFALVWLGWRLLEQDRILEGRRIQERRERATDLIVTALEQSLLAAEQRLADPSAWQHSASSDDALILVLQPKNIETYPKTPLLYYPFRQPLPEAPPELFHAGEEYEFRLRDYTRAVAAFRELARSADPVVRAGAQLRLARNLRKAGQFGGALEAYNELARLSDVAVGGVPADLVARRARGALLAELDRPSELRREAESLAGDLRSARWQLDRGAYSHYAQEVSRWLDAARMPGPEQVALAAAVEQLWERSSHPSSGRESFYSQGRSMTLLWHSTAERLVALVAGPRYLEREWLASLGPLLTSQAVRIALLDRGGHAVFGALPVEGAQQARRVAADTGLPWTLQVGHTDLQVDLAQFAARRRLLLAGLVLLLMVVSTGSYFILRAVARELAVARLQSDFVAAVSHEFRTPLTSLHQVNEILLDGRVNDEDRRHSYYRTQARATDRLRRLVESLLDFGRMEAGARPYRMQNVDAAQLVRSVVEEFQAEADGRGCRIELSLGRAARAVQADPDAIARALWNLLDNAVKYSPDCPTVWVTLGNQGNRVAIGVRDQGLGIPPGEQREIFHKFVRGAACKAVGIKGTGIGLAMVEHIVRAHGGEIRLESEPERGSTFTILLPASIREELAAGTER